MQPVAWWISGKYQQQFVDQIWALKRKSKNSIKKTNPVREQAFRRLIDVSL